MTVKTILNALEIVRENHAETSLRLQQVRDEILELEEKGRPVDISLKSKECELTDKVIHISVTIDELLDAEIK